MKILSYIILLVLFLVRPLWAQVPFDGTYQFPEGVYLTHENFLNRIPDFSWEEIAGEMVQLPEDFRVQIAKFGLKSGNVEVTAYAISLEGFPYFFVKEDTDLHFHEFAGLRVRGPWSYFEYEGTELSSRIMYAYNPANGRPFRQALVEREKNETHRVLINMETGERVELTFDAVANIVASERDILRAVEALKPTDPENFAKLRQAVKLYNERHPLVLPE